MGVEQLVVHSVWDREGAGSSPVSRTKKQMTMEEKMMKEKSPDQRSDIAQQLLPDRLIGRAREFESRGVGSSPAPAANGTIA
jgi:hypothetical protein